MLTDAALSCSRSRSLARGALILSSGLLLLSTSCATPIQAIRRHPQDVERDLDSNAISTGRLSEPTQVVLHREDLALAMEGSGESAAPTELVK